MPMPIGINICLLKNWNCFQLEQKNDYLNLYFCEKKTKQTSNKTKQKQTKQNKTKQKTNKQKRTGLSSFYKALSSKIDLWVMLGYFPVKNQKREGKYLVNWKSIKQKRNVVYGR